MLFSTLQSLRKVSTCSYHPFRPSPHLCLSPLLASAIDSNNNPATPTLSLQHSYHKLEVSKQDFQRTRSTENQSLPTATSYQCPFDFDTDFGHSEGIPSLSSPSSPPLCLLLAPTPVHHSHPISHSLSHPACSPLSPSCTLPSSLHTLQHDLDARDRTTSTRTPTSTTYRSPRLPHPHGSGPNSNTYPHLPKT